MTVCLVFVKTLLRKGQTIFDKVQTNQTNCNKIGIYISWVFVERQDVFKEEKVAGHNCDFRNFFFPQQFAFWVTFQPRLKCNYGPFLYFPHSTLLTVWVFLGFVLRNCIILDQLSALFRKISPPLKHFATSNSRNILHF